MSDLNEASSQGGLCPQWSGSLDDYAIAGGWLLNGDALVVCDAAGSVCGFDGRSGLILWAQSEVHAGGALTLAVDPEGTTFATAGQDGQVLIWNSSDGQIRHVIEVGRGWVEHLAWSPDGLWLAVACARRLYVYSAEGTEIWRSDPHPSTISAIAWSSSEELATACYGQVTFFDACFGEARQTLEWKSSLVSMVLSPDEDTVACASQEKTVHFWRRASGCHSMMRGYASKPSALAFDHQGRFLATGGGEELTVWCFDEGGPEGTQPSVLELHVEPVTTLAFAPVGMRLASGARDGSVVVWSLKSDGQGGVIGAALVPDVVAEVCWRPDGAALAALDGSGGVTVWQLDIEALLIRCLTDGEVDN